MSKRQYEEYEDRLAFRHDSQGSILIVVFLAFVAFTLVMISVIINVTLTLIVAILSLIFAVWIAYWSLTLCELIISRKERVLIHESTKSLSKKKKSRLISFSEITAIQIDIGDELYGGTSEREMYEVVSIKFLIKDGKEFDAVSLKANRMFRTYFNSTEQLVDRLKTFTDISHNTFKYKSHGFLGVGR